MPAAPLDPQAQGPNGADIPGGMGPQGALPAFSQDLLNQAAAESMAASAPGQPFLQPAGLAAMPVAQPGFMMPMMMANGDAPVQPNNSISADDIALYDRQIRLWGMAAQAKIQNANILLITMRALAGEIAKNLVLAGVGSLTLLDGSPVSEVDLGAQFFLADAVVGQNRAESASAAIRRLNPRVKVHVDPESVSTKSSSYFADYDIVIATDLDPDSFNIINTATRINGKAFYAAGTHGMYGFIFSDLIEHDYVIERDAGNVATQVKQETRTRSIVDVKISKDGPKTVESVTKRELYSTWFLASDVAVLPTEYTQSKRRLRSVTPVLSCLRALWEFKQLRGAAALPSNREDLKLFTHIATQKHKALSLPSETLRPELLRSFIQNLGSEIAPVAAILGGQLAQDVINVLGHTQQPIQNLVVLDGDKMEAPMYPLHPDCALGAGLLSVGSARGNGNAMARNGNDHVMMDHAMGSVANLGATGMHAGPLGPMSLMDNTAATSVSEPNSAQQGGPAPPPGHPSAPEHSAPSGDQSTA